MSRKLKILLVEDNPAEAELIALQLARARPFQCAVDHVESIDAARHHLLQSPCDVMLLDLELPDARGFEGLETLLPLVKTAPTIMMTNHPDETLAAKAVGRGAQDYLFKRDIDTRLLVRTIEYAIERQTNQEALRVTQERYSLALAGANDGIWDWDMAGQAVYLSARWLDMVGIQCNGDGMTVAPDEWFSRIPKADYENFQRALDAHLVGALPCFEFEHRLRCESGELIWVLCRGLAVRNDAGKPARMAGSLSDITARKVMEAQLVHDALHDDLTGLPNRNLLLERIDSALDAGTNENDYGFAVLFIDLDRFKTINDSLGHSVGDELLKGVARRLKDNLRPTDTLARLGGDEFAILAFADDDPSFIIQYAERIHRQLTAPFAVNDAQLHIGASIGIAWADASYQRPEELLRDADLAMYRAKGEDRACQVFDQGMHHVAIERLALETDLRNALENDELVVYYQPIISTVSGKVTGLEALLRWNHPTRGFLYPNAFIQVAEESGLVVPIGWWVIERACEEIGALHRVCSRAAEVSVSVNISGKIFNALNITESLKKILRDKRYKAASLHLEITEHSIMNHQFQALQELDSLRNTGIGLHIDDFGTGYSSLSHLQKFSFDTLKIDSSFVTKMETCADSASIVKSIVAMGNMMGMDVVAEGVETPRHFELLSAMGCPHVQGFLFSAAVPAADLPGLLNRDWRTEIYQHAASGVQ